MPRRTISHRRRPDEDEAAEERTSPYPYAQDFGEWVDDETRASRDRSDPPESASPDA